MAEKPRSRMDGPGTRDPAEVGEGGISPGHVRSPGGRDLTPYPLADAMAFMTGTRRGARIITMSVGQWDGLLSGAYRDGWILLELDDAEVPVRAYRKRGDA